MDRTIVLLDAGTGGFVIQENSIRTIPKVSGYLLRHLGTLSVLAQTLEQDLHGADADTELNALIMQVADLAIKRLETSTALASNLPVPVVPTAVGASANLSMASGTPEAIKLEPVLTEPAPQEPLLPKAATDLPAAEDIPSKPAANVTETVSGSGESDTTQPTEIKAEAASPVELQPDAIEPVSIKPVK
jgi:hypothetical protein